MRLQRYEGNPILSPTEANSWESLVTSNPAAWYDEDEGEVKLLYRAAGKDREHLMYLGLAVSKDGYHFERSSNQPVFAPSEDGFDAGCVEDPRVVKFGDYYFFTYASRPTPTGRYWLPQGHPDKLQWPTFPEGFPAALGKNLTSSGLAITKDFKTIYRLGRITNPAFDDRDVMLFPETIGGRYVLLNRPQTPDYGSVWATAPCPTIGISFSQDPLVWPSSKPLIQPKFDWESRKIGGSVPPIKTEKGWLVLYHAVGPDKYYRIGAMLLDLHDPVKVLHRSPNWLLQPEEDYETKGIYNGDVFPCGGVVIGGKLFVYYGGADVCCCLATCDMEELLAYLVTCPP